MFKPDEIEITKLLVFGTNNPSSEDYNEHIRPKTAAPASITYSMSDYMTHGGGIEHKRRLEQIYERVPEQHLKWLKEQLAFSHEISFKNRIKDLCNKFQPIISPLTKNPNKFAAKVRDTRNYYTHYNQSLKSKAAKQNELFRLSQILNFLLQSCLLTELGFTSELCQSLISKDGEYKYLISELEKANFDW
jgi:hypothetical protein